MLSHTSSQPLHRKKEHEWESDTPADNTYTSKGNRTKPKESGYSRHFNAFITFLLALLLMFVTGFPASLFRKSFLCNAFPFLLRNDQECALYRNPEAGWEKLQRFGSEGVVLEAKAAPQKETNDVDLVRRRANELVEKEKALTKEDLQMPRGGIKTKILRNAVARQLEPWVRDNQKPYERKDLEELHQRFPASVRVLVQKQKVEVIHHKEQEEKPEWATWWRGEQLRSMLEWLALRGLLPTYVEFVANLNDKPRVENTDDTKDWPPVFSYCSSEETRDLIFVGYQYHRCFSLPWHTDEVCNSPPWNWTVVSAAHPWESRTDQALWQGAPAGGLYEESNWREKPRSKLVKLSLEYPEILNATFLQCDASQCTPEANWFILNELGYAESTVTMEDQLQYKYLVDIDGESWSPGFFELLSTGAVVFKQQTTYKEFSDIFFKPDIHYIQYSADLHDLPLKIMAALEIDENMQAMGKRAFDTARALVEQAASLEYVAILLKSYAKLLQEPAEK